nr:WRKY [Loropetalum chinense var. rubrum]
MDDHVAIIGDWVPPSPSPRTFFSSMLGDDNGSRSISEPPEENRNEGLFLGSQQQMMSGNTNEKDLRRSGVTGDQLTELNAFSEQKGISRGGLVERIAARAGFNAPRLNTESFRSADLSLNPDARSPYLTIPPGLSPTTLLDSPVFLSNSLAQPSPTTGKFPFVPNSNSRSSTLISEGPDKSRDNFFEDINTSSFAFKPVAESLSSFFLGAASKITPATISQPFPSIEVSVQSENSLRSRSLEHAKVHCQNVNGIHVQADFSRSSTEKDNGGNTAASDPKVFNPVGGSAEHSPPLDEQQEEEGEQRGSGDSMVGGAPSEDGYNWRKYGQKQVKGSEYPRSYYKCTHPNCQVKKKVERSHEGHITEIIYKGAHNHPKPPPNRRSAIGSCNPLSDMQLDIAEQAGPQTGADDLMWPSTQKGTAAAAPDWRHDNLEVTSSATVGPEYCNPSSSLQAQNGTHFESGDAVDASSTFSNDEDEDDRGTHGSVSLGYDGEGDESESKRRKVEAYATEMTARNSSHVNSAASNTIPAQAAAVQTHVHRPEPSQVHNSMARFERSTTSLASFNLPGRQQLGPSHGFSFGMSQPGLAHLAMAGLGPSQGKLPVLPLHPYLAQQREMNEMGFMLPKGEPKVEPMSDSGLNLSNGSSVYQQIMSRLPLGHQM